MNRNLMEALGSPNRRRARLAARAQQPDSFDAILAAELAQSEGRASSCLKRRSSEKTNDDPNSPATHPRVKRKRNIPKKKGDSNGVKGSGFWLESGTVHI